MKNIIKKFINLFKNNELRGCDIRFNCYVECLVEYSYHDEICFKKWWIYWVFKISKDYKWRPNAHIINEHYDIVCLSYNEYKII